MRLRTLVALLVLVAAAACGKSTPTATPTSSPAIIKTQPISIRVQLIDPGKAPRSALRFHLTKGTVTNATMTMNFAISLETNGQAIPTGSVPPITLTMRTEVVDVTPQSATIDFSYRDATVGSGGNAAAAAAMKESVRKIIGIKGRMIVDDTGRMLSFGVQAPAGADAQLQKLLDQIQQQATNLAIPFPEEAVGAGARWRTTTSLHLQGVKASVNLTYTLEQLTGGVAELNIKADEVVPDQNADIPGLPPGVTAKVLATHIKGGGLGEVDLAQILPTSFDQAGSGTITVDVSQGGQTQRLLETIRVEIKIATLK
jgi:uncharacterized protein DUF6263